jgi:hypothetical protein
MLLLSPLLGLLLELVPAAANVATPTTCLAQGASLVPLGLSNHSRVYYEVRTTRRRHIKLGRTIVY